MRSPTLRLPRVVLGGALALIVLLGGGAFAARRAADAAEPLRGSPVSAADLRTLVRAATSCPALTPARLAGQVTVASNFGAGAGTGVGVAALTTEQWRTYAPWPGADPADHEAGITALAHLMCERVGRARAEPNAGDGGDPWRAALTAHASGDKTYVDKVERYAAWYALQPAFRGTPSAAGGGGAVVPVPEPYVSQVVAAGKICPEMPPARIAAQIMATSGFDPAKVGPAGEQGIAQFRPRVWAATVDQAPARTPWDPSVAIPALGRTMCKLVADSGGRYGPALAAFTRGDRKAATPLVEAVDKAQASYAKDARLQANQALGTPAPPPPSAAPSSAKPKPTTKPAAPGRNQPAVKAVAGAGISGPYFLLNLRTHECVDVPGYGAGERDGPVNQFPCAKTGDDNQEWTFEPRAKDSAGYQLYWIRNTDDSFCLDPPGVGPVASSTELIETGCFDGDNQYFRLEPKLTSSGLQYYWLRNTVADMCLDVPGAGTGGPNARLALVPCLSGDDHEWALVEKAEW